MKTIRQIKDEIEVLQERVDKFQKLLEVEEDSVDARQYLKSRDFFKTQLQLLKWVLE